MPVSNDNQDYGKSDEKNKENVSSSSAPNETKFTSDDLKGKKVDADPDRETDRPAEQQK